MKKNLFLLFFTMILLSGCASGFEENYQPVPAFEMEAAVQPCSTTIVQKMSPYESIDTAKERMRSKGYVLMGQAEWESTIDENKQTALEQGQKVGACVVLWRRVDAGTVHTTQRVSEYIPPTTTTVTVRGSRGYEQKTIEVPGRTEYHDEPVTYQRYDFLGLFFGKAQSGGGGYSGGRTHSMGIEGMAPSTEYMARHDSRRGVVVTRVTTNSPAYHANIFPGDVVLQLNGKDVMAGTAISLDPQRENTVLLDRNGKHFVKKIPPSYTKM